MMPWTVMLRTELPNVPPEKVGAAPVSGAMVTPGAGLAPPPQLP